MIDRVAINCSDLAASARFCDAVLATLGQSRLRDFGQTIGYGSDRRPGFWIAAAGQGPHREAHVASAAPDTEQVRAFHRAFAEIGAETLHQPRVWPEYHPRYYGAVVRDPGGNNVEAVCHTAEPDGSVP